MLERTARLFIAAGIASLLLAGCTEAKPRRHHRVCSRVISPGHSVEHLVHSLRPGMTGCLRGGYYGEDVRIGHGGRPGARITLRSYPGQHAAVIGRMYLAPGADYVTISDLFLRDREGDLPSPTVSANHDTFIRDDISNDHTGICLEVNGGAYTTVLHSRIHDCGRLPATNHDHGIYVANGSHTRILHNLIYDNTDRGVQLYPAAYDTLVSGNVIDGNGEGVLFAGDGGSASSRNSVVGNVISNSRIRYNVESFFPDGALGSGNVVTRNCLFGGPRGGLSYVQPGFSAFRNVVANPHYRNRAAKDFRLGHGSRCRSVYR